MYSFFQKILFSLDAEKAHKAALKSLAAAHCLGLDKIAAPAPLSAPCRVMGLDLPNPVGLAAGLDKNGEYIDALSALGFGFLEVGTVTPKPQAGNPKPRLFRIPEQQAVINRMGFNNHGIDALIANVKKAKYRGILGINIGKNAITPIERAVDDYVICLEKAYAHASYITVNISSPNTQNLRSLQQEDELSALLSVLKNKQNELADQHGRYVPLAVKIAPDLDESQIAAAANVIRACKIDGVIATNTTIDKSSLGNHPLAQEAGGLSGKPLREKADAVLQTLSGCLNPSGEEEIPIIGAGGIASGADAVAKLDKGARAVQLYSAMVYQGPPLIHECVRAIAQRKA
ncbi:MAG: quinone-dependent dihydroorotate dehydrogenase [Neisseria sp.]|nr:quinone-dependent dihydroorotate dehydrogenase [Neisseria sp.]